MSDFINIGFYKMPFLYSKIYRHISPWLGGLIFTPFAILAGAFILLILPSSVTIRRVNIGMVILGIPFWFFFFFINFMNIYPLPFAGHVYYLLIFFFIVLAHFSAFVSVLSSKRKTIKKSAAVTLVFGACCMFCAIVFAGFKIIYPFRMKEALSNADFSYSVFLLFYNIAKPTHFVVFFGAIFISMAGTLAMLGRQSFKEWEKRADIELFRMNEEIAALNENKNKN